MVEEVVEVILFLDQLRTTVKMGVLVVELDMVDQGEVELVDKVMMEVASIQQQLDQNMVDVAEVELGLLVLLVQIMLVVLVVMV